MVDKKVLWVIAALLIIALMVFAVAMIRPSFGGGGQSFSELFDKLEMENTTTRMLILGDAFVEDQEVVVKDKIVSMRTDGSTTYFYFIYTGNKWVDESSGTTFHVSDDGGDINVNNAFFSIRINGIYTSSFDVGDEVKLKTTVVMDDDVLVFDHSWEVLIG
ncbi:MAG TPA: hypothetical protein ENN25_04480 [Euryarchaeota archaeon]|nr:hypothetical protein [Euryarchaeota archaeon]